MQALIIALNDVFGIEDSLADIDFAGRTDIWMLRQLLRKFAFAPTAANFGRFFAG